MSAEIPKELIFIAKHDGYRLNNRSLLLEYRNIVDEDAIRKFLESLLHGMSAIVEVITTGKSVLALFYAPRSGRKYNKSISTLYYRDIRPDIYKVGHHLSIAKKYMEKLSNYDEDSDDEDDDEVTSESEIISKHISSEEIIKMIKSRQLFYQEKLAYVEKLPHDTWDTWNLVFTTMSKELELLGEQLRIALENEKQ